MHCCQGLEDSVEHRAWGLRTGGELPPQPVLLISGAEDGVQIIGKCFCLFLRSLQKRSWLCRRSSSWFWTSLRKLRWDGPSSRSSVDSQGRLRKDFTGTVSLFRSSQNLFGKMANILEKIKKWVFPACGFFLVRQFSLMVHDFKYCACVSVCVCAHTVSSCGFSQSWLRSCMLVCWWPSSPPACCPISCWDSS